MGLVPDSVRLTREADDVAYSWPCGTERWVPLGTSSPWVSNISTHCLSKELMALCSRRSQHHRNMETGWPAMLPACVKLLGSLSLEFPSNNGNHCLFRCLIFILLTCLLVYSCIYILHLSVRIAT